MRSTKNYRRHHQINVLMLIVVFVAACTSTPMPTLSPIPVPPTPIVTVSVPANPSPTVMLSATTINPLPATVPAAEEVEIDIDQDNSNVMEINRMNIQVGDTVLAAALVENSSVDAVKQALSKGPITLMTLITGTFALVGTVAPWSLSFGRTHQLTLQHLEKTRNPIRTGHHAINAVMGMVAGLIAVAIANEAVMAHPYGHTSFSLSMLLGVGLLIFLIT